MNLAHWVSENAERIELAREKALVTNTDIAHKRNTERDQKAKDRMFDEGDEVLVRKPGMNLKLFDSWESPYTVTKRNSPLSYAINTGDRHIPSVHVQLMKRYLRENDTERVNRVISVFEGDTADDEIVATYAETTIVEQELQQSQTADIDKVLSKYADVMTAEPGLTSLTEFAIETGETEPIFQRAYNTPAALKASIDTEIDWLLDKHYIQPSTSPWSSPMVTVRKPDGTVRLCVDFKKTNAVTRQQPFYMPRVEEVLEGVGKAAFIPKLDLSKGYYQIKMRDSDISKTAFICHRGKFEFLRMPFGVKNATAVFQELMQTLLSSHKAFSTPYMDDVVIYSNSWADHIQHIDMVLATLRQAGLTANPKKCRWGGKSIEFLGHQVRGGRMSMLGHRAQALSNYTRPSTKKGLRAFLGSIGFYRRYVSQLANQTSILTPLTAKQVPQRVVWTEEGKLVFTTICNTISNACSLCIPLPSDSFSIVTDASGRGVGGVLQVKREDSWEAAAFFSRQLRGAKQRYSATELEALALVASVQHFSYYLYGTPFIVYTDHKPLEHLMTSDGLNPSLRRMAFKLQH